MKASRLLPHCCLLALLLLPLPARADSTINSTNSFAWGANIGWTNWRPIAADGVVTGEFICSGYIWGANVGEGGIVITPTGPGDADDEICAMALHGGSKLVVSGECDQPATATMSASPNTTSAAAATRMTKMRRSKKGHPWSRIATSAAVGEVLGRGRNPFRVAPPQRSTLCKQTTAFSRANKPSAPLRVSAPLPASNSRDHVPRRAEDKSRAPADKNQQRQKL